MRKIKMIKKGLYFIGFLVRVVGAASTITLFAVLYYRLNLQEASSIMIVKTVFGGMLLVVIVIQVAIYAVQHYELFRIVEKK